MAIIVSSNSITYSDDSAVRGTSLNGFSPYINFSSLLTANGRVEFTDSTVTIPSIGTTNTNVLYNSIAFFNTSTTWTVPADVTRVRAIIVNGGSAGTFSTTIPRDSDQGGPIVIPGNPGSPGFVNMAYVPVTPLTNVTVTVGAGGTASGGAGGASSLSVSAPADVSVRVDTDTATQHFRSQERPLKSLLSGNTYVVELASKTTPRTGGSDPGIVYVQSSTLRPGAGGDVSTGGVGGVVMLLW